MGAKQTNKTELYIYIYIYKLCTKSASKNSPNCFATFGSSACQSLS